MKTIIGITTVAFMAGGAGLLLWLVTVIVGAFPKDAEGYTSPFHFVAVGGIIVFVGWCVGDAGLLKKR